MKKSAATLLALLLALTFVLAGCGSSEAETEPAPETAATVAALEPGQPLELTDWSMNATAWSSPNGATVNLKAVPNGYAEGQKAVFCVRLEGDDVENVECIWDGTVYTASVDLNSADGYCYYVLLTAADGTETEVAINTPNVITDDSLINMETALNAYCEATVTDFETKDGKLTVKEGLLTVHLPWLTLDTEAVTCQNAVIFLTHNENEVSSQVLTAAHTEIDGTCQMDLAGVSFDLPGDIADDHKVGMRLDVTLTNGQTLSTSAGSWFYLNEELILAVG